MALQDAPAFAVNEPHPRYSPYSTSFTTKDGGITCLRYLASLEEDAACIRYFAEISIKTDVDEDFMKVVVNFVPRYGEEVHEFLAQNGCALTLRYCGSLPETTPLYNFSFISNSVPKKSFATAAARLLPTSPSLTFLTAQSQPPPWTLLDDLSSRLFKRRRLASSRRIIPQKCSRHQLP